MERIDDLPDPLLPISRTFFFLLRTSMVSQPRENKTGHVKTSDAAERTRVPLPRFNLEKLWIGKVMVVCVPSLADTRRHPRPQRNMYRQGQYSMADFRNSRGRGLKNFWPDYGGVFILFT